MKRKMFQYKVGVLGGRVIYKLYPSLLKVSRLMRNVKKARGLCFDPIILENKCDFVNERRIK